MQKLSISQAEMAALYWGMVNTHLKILKVSTPLSLINSKRYSILWLKEVLLAKGTCVTEKTELKNCFVCCNWIDCVSMRSLYNKLDKNELNAENFPAKS